MKWRARKRKLMPMPEPTIALKNGMQVRICMTATVNANKVGTVLDADTIEHGVTIVRVMFVSKGKPMIVRYTLDQIADLKISWEGNALLKEQELQAAERQRQCSRAGDLSTLVDM